MKDIDFDELDKAVNSLMAGASRPEVKSADVPTETLLEIPPNPIADSPETVAGSSIQRPTAEIPKPRAAQPVPAAKRSGRFMDMIPKASDAATRPASVSPSREGVAIIPRPNTIPERPQTPETDSVEDSATVVEPSTVEVESAPTEPGLRIPAAETPFLSDAKVDKRPLNAAGISDGESDPIELVDIDQERGADEPPVLPEVPELDNDLLAIEAGNDQPVAQTVETTDVAADVEPPVAPLGAASIAQQYVTQPSSGDQSHAAIYDASQYPEPVAHPAKKKAGWLWVLWVILLLGVGAGVAVLLYVIGIIP